MIVATIEARMSSTRLPGKVLRDACDLLRGLDLAVWDEIESRRKP